MKYLQEKFSTTAPGTQQYRDNWDAIYGKKQCEAEADQEFCGEADDFYKDDIRLDVETFHKAYGLPILSTPTVPSDDRLRLRLRLIAEEFFELMNAAGLPTVHVEAELETVIAHGELVVDLVEVADALGDMDVVNEGMRLECGINGQPIREEIFRSNMSKLGADGKPLYREDGKVKKGPNFSPPAIAELLRKQGWTG